MRLKGLFQLNIAILILAASASDSLAADKDLNPVAAANSLTDYLGFLDPPQQCANMEAATPATSSDCTVFWRNIECRDLFSSTPPKDYSRKGADPRTWRPVCSMTFINDVRRTDPQTSLRDAIASEKSYTLERDLCAQGAGTMRYDDAYVPPSQEAWGATLMSADERISYLSLVKQTRDDTAQACCSGDSTCLDWFSKIQVVFCVPETDPKKPDPCVEAGTQFSLPKTDELQQFYRTFKTAKAGAGNLKLPDGEVDLTPLNSGSNGGPEDGPSLIAHEFGHACSFVRRALSTNAGNEAAYKQVYENCVLPDGACKLSPHTIQTYSKLFQEMGFSNSTYQCALEYSRLAPKKRYQPGSCKGGCESSAMEEGLANLISYKTTRTEFGDVLLERLCQENRDSLHPLATDVLACALKTPALERRFRDWTACQ